MGAPCAPHQKQWRAWRNRARMAKKEERAAWRNWRGHSPCAPSNPMGAIAFDEGAYVARMVGFRHANPTRHHHRRCIDRGSDLSRGSLGNSEPGGHAAGSVDGSNRLVRRRQQCKAGESRLRTKVTCAERLVIQNIIRCRNGVNYGRFPRGVVMKHLLVWLAVFVLSAPRVNATEYHVRYIL
jgi:hypothetical protein